MLCCSSFKAGIQFWSTYNTINIREKLHNIRERQTDRQTKRDRQTETEKESEGNREKVVHCMTGKQTSMSTVPNAAVLNLFRLTDHLVNFVSVRRPPRLLKAKEGPWGKNFNFPRKISGRPFFLANYEKFSFFTKISKWLFCQLHKKFHFLVTVAKKIKNIFLFAYILLKIKYILGLAWAPKGR